MREKVCIDDYIHAFTIKNKILNLRNYKFAIYKKHNSSTDVMLLLGNLRNFKFVNLFIPTGIEKNLLPPIFMKFIPRSSYFIVKSNSHELMSKEAISLFSSLKSSNLLIFKTFSKKFTFFNLFEYKVNLFN